MRLAAQMRGGFYPAARQAIAHAARFLRPPAQGPFAMLDPCAGQGAAIRQLAELLGCRPAMTYAIELDDSRAERLLAALPDAHVLAPASFLGCRASSSSFAFIWLNPPFDHAYGGVRVEAEFLRTATDWLMTGGVMALVCPESVVDAYSDVRPFLTMHYERCTILPFPEDHRPFNEVVVLAHKRSRLQVSRENPASWDSIQAPRGFIYRIPPCAGPRVFQKVEPTAPELERMLAGSPLRSYLAAPVATGVARPPLALATGHVALLLASGHLDGVVHPEGKPPHVVRGTARKREYVADVTETVNDDGSTTTRTTIAERIELVVRTVDLTGVIQTFQESSGKDV